MILGTYLQVLSFIKANKIRVNGTALNIKYKKLTLNANEFQWKSTGMSPRKEKTPTYYKE